MCRHEALVCRAICEIRDSADEQKDGRQHEYCSKHNAETLVGEEGYNRILSAAFLLLFPVAFLFFVFVPRYV